MAWKAAAAAVREELRKSLDQQEGPPSDESLLSQIEAAVFGYSQRRSYLSAGEKRMLIRELFHAIRGLDVLQPLVEDRTISEIMVNGHEDIFIEREGRVSRYPAAFESEERLLDLIQSIVAKVNRIVNESSPIVDARLPDGSRVHAVLPPIALNGPVLTIRKFPDRPLRMSELIAKDSISSEAADWLERLVRSRYNLFISGGTGSGKTTFLNALTEFIPADERIVTIEDSAELQIRTIPNRVALETRNANTEGKGEITIRQLIRASLRMRPNRIIVGEVRGAEALDMLQAMNTGHDGSLSTGHANSVADMLSRLETMVLSGSAIPLEAVRRQIASAIDVVIQLSRLRDHSRRVVEIVEIVDADREGYVLNPLFRFQECGVADGSEGQTPMAGRLLPTGHAMAHPDKLRSAGFPVRPEPGASSC